MSKRIQRLTFRTKNKSAFIAKRYPHVSYIEAEYKPTNASMARIKRVIEKDNGIDWLYVQAKKKWQ